MRFCAYCHLSAPIFAETFLRGFYHSCAFQGSAGNFSVLTHLFFEVFLCKGSLELCNALVAVLRCSVEQVHLYAQIAFYGVLEGCMEHLQLFAVYNLFRTQLFSAVFLIGNDRQKRKVHVRRHFVHVDVGRNHITLSVSVAQKSVRCFKKRSALICGQLLRLRDNPITQHVDIRTFLHANAFKPLRNKSSLQHRLIFKCEIII